MASRQLTSLSMSLLAATLASSTAFGQALSLNPNSEGVQRDAAHDLDNDEINRADCERNEVINFNVGVTGAVPNTLDFQVWRGTACADGDTRFEDTTNCAQIMVQETRNENSLDVDISVRQIMAARRDGGGTGGSGGTSGTGGSAGTAGIDSTGAGNGGTAAFGGTGGTGGFGGIDQAAQANGEAGADTSSDLGATVCQGDPSFPEPTELALHFILVDGNGDQPGGNYTPAIWNARYDLIGPAKPRNVTAGIGESTLVLNWAIEDDRGDIDHYNAYCAPPPGVAANDPEECPNDLAGLTNPPSEFFCGESDGYSASMQTLPLENNVMYSVAIAGVDHFKNLGDLSDPACEAPQLVRDFYEAYRQAGGQGGGGFCAVGGGRSHGSIGLVALAGLALYVRRRAATRERRAS